MLELIDVKSGYGRIEAIHGVNVVLDAGTCVGIIGSNGAGKSTTLNTVSGILRTTAGEIRFRGKSIRGKSPYHIARAGLVQVPEGRRILPALSVRDNLTVSCGRRCSGDERQRRIAQVFTLFPVLETKRHQLGGSLSGGQQQMLAIGRALMSRPSVIMLDEPSLGLAPVVVSELFESLDRLRNTGVAILMVEQNAARALDFVDHCYVMEAGRIVAEGSSDSLRTNEQITRHYLAMDASAHQTHDEERN
jgi:branched-chain amino acid transport system ATP-binding protein